ncbi:uncharacterized protein LOC103478590 isoform X2 [Poecilia reticulata]|uniref:uncharacterized protein LOC103478590 isoform X2 n=1 Tax=Poecilia reticulata TaxID=8081 RepID=UPI0004A31420|nr:PREDICTED: uncharacterized protein LOC103478590 isoform X2 [Poecilia reticulata]
MSLEQAAAALLVKNDQLKREIEHLRYLVNLLQDNQMLTSRTHSSSDSILTDLTGSKHSDQWHSSIEEQQFMRDLHQNRPNVNFRTSSPVNFKSNMNFRTSSPVNFKSFLQSSVLKNAQEAEELQSQADVPPFALGHPRLLGEIAYQLDRRILSYVFQAHQRLYGFILLNIPQRIVEVTPVSERNLQPSREFLLIQVQLRVKVKGEHSPSDRAYGRGVSALSLQQVHRPHGVARQAGVQISSPRSVL